MWSLHENYFGLGIVIRVVGLLTQHLALPRAKVSREQGRRTWMALLWPCLENYITFDILYLLRQKLTQVQGEEIQTLPPNGRNIKITVRKE